jgi:hypothetical protein
LASFLALSRFLAKEALAHPIGNAPQNQGYASENQLLDEVAHLVA